MARPNKRIEFNEKTRITNNIIDDMSLEGLTPEQIEVLKKRLDDTLANYEVEIDDAQQVLTEDANMKILDDFIASKRIENKSQSTIYNYYNEISKMFKVLNKPLQKIDANDIRRYMDYRHQHDGLSARTTNNIRMYLLSFYKWLIAEEIVVKNPMMKIAPVKYEKKVVDTLTDEEAEMIRCACDNERDLAIIDLLSGSGMRVSELCRLNRSDVNFDTNEIKVFGKGSKERTCFLTGKAKVHLRWYLESRMDDSEALFVTAKSPYSRLTKNGVEYILKNVAAASKVPKLHLYPHKYRSTLATNMLNKGAAAENIQQVLGHASVDTTLSVYCRVDKDTIKRAHHTYVS